MRNASLLLLISLFLAATLGVSGCNADLLSPTSPTTTGVAESPPALTAPAPSLGAEGKAEAHSASVASGFPCGIGVLGGFPFMLTTDSHAVQSNSGNVTLICRGQLPAGTEPTQTQVQRPEDFPIICGAFFATTTRFRQVITPSGKITLRCQALRT